jgi:hypothetical protein
MHIRDFGKKFDIFQRILYDDNVIIHSFFHVKIMLNVICTRTDTKPHLDYCVEAWRLWRPNLKHNETLEMLHT